MNAFGGRPQSNRTCSILFSATLLLLPGSLLAQEETQDSNTTTVNSARERIDIGGVKFDGAGDKRNPRCQISHPLSASSAFYIEWNCEDDTATRGEIVSEIWILRVGAPRYVKVDDYIGFPASLEVNEALVGGPFSQWLPASFILVARDTAGNASISAPFVVTNRDNDVDSCSLTLSTRATESDGSTTGIPSMSVLLSDVETFTQSSTNTAFTVSMFSPAIAQTCEIDELCDYNESELFFRAAVSVDESGNASARMNLDPGEIAINLEGDANVQETLLESLRLSGTTIIDNVVTDVELSCSQS